MLYNCEVLITNINILEVLLFLIMASQAYMADMKLKKQNQA